MIQKPAFTRIDAIVVIACVVFLFVNIGVITAGGRERAKKEVCLENLRSLTAGWQMYAEDNGGKIVNGAPSNTNTPCPAGMGCQSGPYCAAAAPTSSIHANELPWIGPAWGSTNLDAGNQCCQTCAIKTGALWKYVQNLDIYRCPDSNKIFLVTYSIVDSMNGKYKYNGNCAMSDTPANLMSKNLNQIAKPAQRLLFFEEGQPTPDSYAVFYACEKWFDPPAVTHNDGTSVSFADGHSAYWKWKAKETINAAKNRTVSFAPPTRSAKQDLYRVQIGTWTKLGYTPTAPIE